MLSNSTTSNLFLDFLMREITFGLAKNMSKCLLFYGLTLGGLRIRLKSELTRIFLILYFRPQAVFAGKKVKIEGCPICLLCVNVTRWWWLL